LSFGCGYAALDYFSEIFLKIGISLNQEFWYNLFRAEKAETTD